MNLGTNSREGSRGRSPSHNYDQAHHENCRPGGRASPRASGSVLVTTVVFCGVVGIILVAYLSMLQTQHRFTHRAQVWNNCIPLCEAGIEEAMAHINHVNTGSNFAINGWVLYAGAYRKERALSGGTIRMAIDTSIPPLITVNGFLRAPMQTNYLTRTVRVRTKLSQRFPYAILSKGNVTCNSSGACVDSFDSTDPLKSTLGQYDPLKAQDQAIIATTAKTAGAINIGNLSLYGYAGTGPGGSVDILANGNVGSTLFNSNPLFDGSIESGHFSDDVNVYIPDLTPPSAFAGTPPTGGMVGGTNYLYILGTGDYLLSTLNVGNGERVLVTGNARLYVTGSTSVSGPGGTGPGQIDIATGAQLEFYTGGSVDIKGNVNNPGLAKDFSLLGLKTCTSITYSGGAAFVGTVYAPQATVTITGGAGLYGAVVSSICKITGGMSVHYDEALKGNPREGRYIAAVWLEL